MYVEIIMVVFLTTWKFCTWTCCTSYPYNDTDDSFNCAINIA